MQPGNPCLPSFNHDGGINHVFPSYFIENTKGHFPQRKKKSYTPCAYLFIIPNQTEEVARFRRRWYTPDIPSTR